MTGLNIDALRYFVSVAHHKSISKAAQEMYITQSALSRHIFRLEEELGCALFERSRGTAACLLTEVGQQCLRNAEQALEQIDCMLDLAHSFSSGEKGSLTVGFSGYEGTWFLEWMYRIRTQYPNIELRSKRLNWSELGSGILDGSIDIAVFPSGYAFPGSEQFRYIELTESNLQILVPGSHPFAGREWVTPDELENQMFVGHSREVAPPSFDAFVRLCMHYGFEPKYVSYHDHTKMVFGDVFANRGICVYDSSGPLEEGFLSRINVRLAPDDPYPRTYLSFVYNKNNTSLCLQNVLQISRELKHDLFPAP